MKKSIKFLSVLLILSVAFVPLIGCSNASTIRVSIYNGTLFAYTATDAEAGTFQGQIQNEITSTELVANGARRVSVNFGLAEAIRNYSGYYLTAQVGNLVPAVNAELVPFDYGTNWQLAVRVIIEIRSDDFVEDTFTTAPGVNQGVLMRNLANPPLRVLWQHQQNVFWDANMVAARGLGTVATGGFERIFTTDRDNQGNPLTPEHPSYPLRTGREGAFRLNAFTLPLFNTMDFFVAGFMAGTYQVRFRFAVATVCQDAGHIHYQTFIFNDLTTVEKSFTVS